MLRLFDALIYPFSIGMCNRFRGEDGGKEGTNHQCLREASAKPMARKRHENTQIKKNLCRASAHKNFFWSFS